MKHRIPLALSGLLALVAVIVWVSSSPRGTGTAPSVGIHAPGNAPSGEGESRTPWQSLKTPVTARDPVPPPASLASLAGLSFDDAMAEARGFLENGNITGALSALSGLKYKSTRTRAIRELLQAFLATSPTDQQLMDWFRAFEPGGALENDASLVHGESSALVSHLARQPTDTLVSLLPSLKNPTATQLVSDALHSQSKRNPEVLQKLKPLGENLRGMALVNSAKDSQHLNATEFKKKLEGWNVPEHEREAFWQIWARGKKGLPSEALFAEADSVASPQARETLRLLAYQRWLREEPLAASEAILKNAGAMPPRTYDLLLVDLVDIAKADKDPAAARAWAATARTEEMKAHFQKVLGPAKPESNANDRPAP